ncbi:hypothetical protein SPACI_054960 [Sporomusa acidovorans DSM 3132]|uniref:Uncharacterized protein n=1 Tax=Sporomusa acidovorans (strain ATCC 49682 / DSM 3132 / Mol) TaxID=1123286 RepID=A0ABZ3JB94_SPOA4|nr:hypothetical protein SPACI_57940 [Sporomusa acidovorans DSM 3132]SDD97570.1 hypothetical protein SAMN04488499_100655 [Sporomusa acidovorans]
MDNRQFCTGEFFFRDSFIWIIIIILSLVFLFIGNAFWSE